MRLAFALDAISWCANIAGFGNEVIRELMLRA